MATAKGPRKASTYRAARRNAVLRTTPKGVWRGAPVRMNPGYAWVSALLNRSRRWPAASTYAQARERSPSSRIVV